MAAVNLRPMRLRVMHAVYASHVPQVLRPLAVAASWFADDEGGNVWPSVATLSAMLECDARTVRRHLHALRELGVLVAEGRTRGGRGQTTHYRFDLDVLARLKPGQWRQALHVKRGRPDQGLGAPKTLTPTVENPDTGDTKPGHGRSETLTAPSADLKDLTENQHDLTGARAPVVSGPGQERSADNKPLHSIGAHPTVSAAPPARAANDWYAECQQLHGGACGLSRMKHSTRMLLDAKAMPA